MADVPFKLYPRGFLGAMLEGRIEKKTEMRETGLGWRFANAVVMRNQNEIDHSHPDVERLYSQYINRAPNCTSFEFKRDVLKTALTAFGTPLFDFWYRMQFKSPASGSLHREFLEDTLHFIQEGRRNVSLETWGSLLNGEEGRQGSDQISLYAEEFFGITSGGVHRYPSNRQLTEVIQRWCSKPNGLEDLLCTMHLLFGKD